MLLGLSRYNSLYIGIVILSGVVYLEGLFATKLNLIYYSLYGPFYDSVAYLNQLAKTMEISHLQGLYTAIQFVMNSSTVFLPFLEAAILGQFFEPTREVGIWLQVIWLWVLAICVFCYLYNFYFRKLGISLALTFPFLYITAIFEYNGGLSDFRMDLHLYLLTGISLTWFLITRHTTKLYPWIITGIFLGLTCLARATAPVYFVVALGPILVARFVKTEELSRSSLLKRSFLMIFTGCLVCAWFYIRSAKYLYFYYFIWNIDANAHLPIQTSIQHFNFAMKTVGWSAAILGAVLLPFTITSYIKKYNKYLNSFKILTDIDWELLWIGISPIGFLVLRGAGLNPFVVMPAAFGLILFILKPFKVVVDPLPSILNSLWILLVSSFLFITSAIQGVSSHIYPKYHFGGSSAANREVVDSIIRDSKKNGYRNVKFSLPYISYLSVDGIKNVFLFDYKYKKDVFNSAISRVDIIENHSLAVATPAEWNRVPGKTDEDKINTLVELANKSLNYLVVPEDDAISFIEENAFKEHVNLYTRKIKSKLIKSGNWEIISDNIIVNDNEIVKVYHNKSQTSYNRKIDGRFPTY